MQRPLDGVLDRIGLPVEGGEVSEADCAKTTSDPGPTCEKALVEVQNQIASKTAQRLLLAVLGCFAQISRRQARNQASSSKLPPRHPSLEDGQFRIGASSFKQRSIGWKRH